MHRLILTGRPSGRVKETKDYFFFRMKEGGTNNSPKGLNPGSEIEFTVFMSKKAGYAIRIKELPEDVRLVIHAEIAKGYPKEHLHTTMGVTAYDTKLMVSRDQPLLKDLPEPEPEDIQPEEVVLNTERSVLIRELIIPEAFFNAKPSQEKVKEKIEFMETHGWMDKPIGVKLVGKKLVISDGYTRYLAAKQLHWRKVTVKILEICPEEELQGVEAELEIDEKAFEKAQLVPLRDLIVPDTFLATPPRQEKINEKKYMMHRHKQMDKPIGVKLVGDQMVLVDGYARYVAAKELYWKKVPVIIHESSSEEPKAEAAKDALGERQPSEPQSGVRGLNSTYMVRTDDLIIPEAFLQATPRAEKIQDKVNYVEKHGKLDKPIGVKLEGEKWVIADGYTRFLAAKQLQWEQVLVKILEIHPDAEETAQTVEETATPKEESVADPYALHSEHSVPTDDLIIPETFLQATPRQEKIQDKLRYLETHGKLDKPIGVNRIGMQLVIADGYTRFLAAQQLGWKQVLVKILESCPEEKTEVQA